MKAVECCVSPGYLNLVRIDAVETDIARTLMARDYKGFGTGTETQNGVIEWMKLK